MKLTPLVAIVPFLLWREWRWVRVYLLSLAALFGLVLAINGPVCLADCFLRVIPSMSAGIVTVSNHSILSAFQLAYLAWKQGDVTVRGLPIPHAIGALGKATGLVCLIVMAVLVARPRTWGDRYSRSVALSLFAMISVFISPVSWTHAYVLCLLPLLMLWSEIFRIEVTMPYLTLLTVTTLELDWFAVGFMVKQRTHILGLAFSMFMPVLLGMLLIVYRLAKQRFFTASPNLPMSESVPAVPFSFDPEPALPG